MIYVKGIAELEFIISVFVFITTISFVTFLIISNIPILHSLSASESLKSKSYQYSELLLFDEGAPMNWEDESDTQNIKRIGLSGGRRYFVDVDKIAKLNSICSNYQLARQKLGLENEDIVIEVSYLDDTPLNGLPKIICGPSVTTQVRQQFQTTRLGVMPRQGGDTYVIQIKVTVTGD